MLLTIVTITKDDFKGFQRTLESTKVLIGRNFVNQIAIDGSTSNKKRNEDAAKGKRIDYYWREPQGIADAFNFGLSKSKADWVWFLNGGDMFNKDMNIDFLATLLNSTSAKILIFNHLADGRVVTKPPLYSIWPPIPNWIPHLGVIVKRDLLLENGGFSRKYAIASDYEKMLQIMLKNVETDLISIPLGVFTSGGVSSNKKVTGKEGLRIIIANLPEICKKSAGNFLKNLKGILNYFHSSK